MKMKDAYGEQYQVEVSNKAFRLDSVIAEEIIFAYFLEEQKHITEKYAYIMVRTHFYGDEYHFYNCLERSLIDAGLKYTTNGRSILLSEEAATFLALRGDICLESE